MMPETSDVLEAVLRLPAKYKEAIYLYYYEGYAVKSLLVRGRSKLEVELKEELAYARGV